MPEPAPHIGTLREGPLHASLKDWYRQPGDRAEIPVGRFVADLVRDGLVIEIQTSGFSKMRSKVSELLARGNRVRIVHPIASSKWIVKVSEDGTFERRRSPKHGRVIDVFAELVSFPELVITPGLEIELVLTVEEELRGLTPGRSWRRKGWSVLERRLVEVIDTHLIESAEDLARLLPASLPETFTTADLASALPCNRRLAQQMAYCLRRTDQIVVNGKRGQSVEYRSA